MVHRVAQDCHGVAATVVRTRRRMRQPRCPGAAHHGGCLDRSSNAKTRSPSTGQDHLGDGNRVDLRQPYSGLRPSREPTMSRRCVNHQQRALQPSSVRRPSKATRPRSRRWGTATSPLIARGSPSVAEAPTSRFQPDCIGAWPTGKITQSTLGRCQWWNRPSGDKQSPLRGRRYYRGEAQRDGRVRTAGRRRR